MSPDNRLLERPQPGGYEGRTVTATYFVESTVPVPPADKCEIDLSGNDREPAGGGQDLCRRRSGGQGAVRMDRDAGRSVAQRQGPIADTLFCGEPIRFFAGMAAGPERVGGPL